MIYKDKIRHLRDRNDLKEIELANYLNISKSLYSEYENEIKIMPIKHLNKICNYFNVSFDYIFNFTTTTQYSKANLAEDLSPKIIAQRLKKIRKEYKLTQEDLGKIVGCSYGTIAGYEIGRYLISTPILYKICKKFNISADYLLGRISENNS